MEYSVIDDPVKCFQDVFILGLQVTPKVWQGIVSRGLKGQKGQQVFWNRYFGIEYLNKYFIDLSHHGLHFFY